MVQENNQSVKAKASVVVGLLSHKGDFHPDMLVSLDRLYKHTKDSGVGIAIAKTFGSMIPLSRNRIAQRVLDEGVDYLLFVDSDMVFEKDALMQLLKHDRDIVSGLAVSRVAPYKPVAKMLQDDGKYKIREKLDEGRFYSDLDMVGCAFMLIKADVLKNIDRPWFAMPPYFDGVMGEDVYFCRKAKEQGYDICVDTSLLIGHIGDRAYTIYDHQEYMEMKEELKTEE